MRRRLFLIALAGAAGIAGGCGGDGGTDSDIERVERRYEQLWDVEEVSCQEAPGQEGYDCRIVSRRKPTSPAR
jgi:hypothetical protein